MTDEANPQGRRDWKVRYRKSRLCEMARMHKRGSNDGFVPVNSVMVPPCVSRSKRFVDSAIVVRL